MAKFTLSPELFWVGLPALPLLLLLLPDGEGWVKGSLLGQERGAQALDFGPPTNSRLATVKTMTRLLVGQVGGAWSIWRQEGLM